jgi:hypothetical protein
MTGFKLVGASAVLSILTALQPPAYASQGREIVAPLWSFACMNDQGPSECGQHVWFYGAGEQPIPVTHEQYARKRYPH